MKRLIIIVFLLTLLCQVPASALTIHEGVEEFDAKLMSALDNMTVSQIMKDDSLRAMFAMVMSMEAKLAGFLEKDENLGELLLHDEIYVGRKGSSMVAIFSGSDHIIAVTVDKETNKGFYMGFVGRGSTSLVMSVIETLDVTVHYKVDPNDMIDLLAMILDSD